MAINLIAARENDAKIIAELKHTIWCTTYRGIYSDEIIDNFDYEEHIKRNLCLIKNPACHVYLIMDEESPIGYFALMNSETVYIQSLYICQEYQHQGIGRRVFAFIKRYCQENGTDKFSCNCNSHNVSAQGFYRAMGGTIIGRDEGHVDKRDDQITFAFRL